MMMLMIMMTSSIRLLVQSILCSTLPEHVYILNRCFVVQTPCAVGAFVMNTPELVCQCSYSSRCHRILYFARLEVKYTSQFLLQTLCEQPTQCAYFAHYSQNRDHFLSLCDISGSHSGDADGMSLLGRDAVSLGE